MKKSLSLVILAFLGQTEAVRLVKQNLAQASVSADDFTHAGEHVLAADDDNINRQMNTNPITGNVEHPDGTVTDQNGQPISTLSHKQAIVQTGSASSSKLDAMLKKEMDDDESYKQLDEKNFENVKLKNKYENGPLYIDSKKYDLDIDKDGNRIYPEVSAVHLKGSDNKNATKQALPQQVDDPRNATNQALP